MKEIWNENARFKIITMRILNTETENPVEILILIQNECANDPTFNESPRYGIIRRI